MSSPFHGCRLKSGSDEATDSFPASSLSRFHTILLEAMPQFKRKIFLFQSIADWISMSNWKQQTKDVPVIDGVKVDERRY